MAFLAQRGSAMSIGVSRLHGEVSRQIFQPLFPRWPSCEVPITHVTNGVHIPTWESAGAGANLDQSPRQGALAFSAQYRWRAHPRRRRRRIVVDARRRRRRVVQTARKYLSRQIEGQGFGLEDAQKADTVLDPNVLTLGFARRFTEYKRPNFLLSDKERFGKMLLNPDRPVQIVVAGKAHAADHVGKEMIREWINFAASRASAAMSYSSRIMTSRWHRNWCRVWTSGSTRRAGHGRRAAPAA